MSTVTTNGGSSPGALSPGVSPGVSGRKRTTNRAYKAEDQALSDITQEAEARLAKKRQARAEARTIRMRELEKLQKEAEEQMDKEYEQQKEEKKSKSTGVLPATVPNSSGGSSSRRGSTDSNEFESATLKEALADLEEKYKKAMMNNAQLDNEKGTLIFEVDMLKDLQEELEESMMEIQREAKDKHRELESKKRENKLLQIEVDNLKEMVSQRDTLIAENGLLLVGAGDEERLSDKDLPEGQTSHKPKLPKVGTIVVVSPEAAELLEVVGDGPLDVRLKRFVEERKELLENIRRLEIDLEEEKEKVASAERRRPAQTSSVNGPEIEMLDIQREASRQVNEYRFKYQKAEQELATLEGHVMRLEGQVKRYKTAADTGERVEEELKQERRKLQREIRTLKDQNEEFETENSHLTKRLEKMKSAKLSLIK
ncbi:leucine-rich repeat flightless-interacting protein 2-like [Patiria miniata]|uniref:Leucine-rich repeat flightless-interacting protein 2 n=1 Tax=Patiria miniata TaxID=46514 RepID=A0A913YXQ3_PATMI|nr:leucine-rich repeat flightless-interacting protein 2-like [Patiria miniata]XP_038044535.1 leucine-rich repeat flightless-interacting protein 2-like [Patiria miniata]